MLKIPRCCSFWGDARVFENIIAQPAADQLKQDIVSRRLAPSMLFFGPPASGKGSAALELARILSCENGDGPAVIAPWNCSCPACTRHRSLIHGDLLLLGQRAFAPEIAASRAAFLREGTAAVRTLFVRSLRKLLARFSPALWEDDSKLGKWSPLLQAIEEELDDFESRPAGDSVMEKLTGSLAKNALKLETEGMSETIPIAQIRRAAYWSRLAPAGRRKTLVIENADRMQEGARNSLLKILEEPPETVSIILTVHRREAVLPTILSRLRPYRFLKREEQDERDIIRRVFRDSPPEGEARAVSGFIGAYLDSFLPQSAEKFRPLAAFFIVSLARAAAVSLKKRGVEIPAEITAMGSYCAPIAEGGGYEKARGTGDIIARLLAESGNFEGRSFPRFLHMALDLAAQSLREGTAGPHTIAYNDIWRKHCAGAVAAAGVWNQNPALALESLFFRLKEALAGEAPQPDT
jgi:DNA polymerase-3 subunit gamma/tau